ncbi:SGNH/GDSL hydrolase family protein [Mangrovimonas aestuarii]|uniref:G-D-S-L family lipolytic protein n=1 Tax=Mangrovimonas aestuarii TaxID=3018443 RepID=UPI0023790454|nr:G-D-S-L family lipolytic protein [Mangrovimonas aestuarii]
MKTKYIWMAFLALGLTACDSDDDSTSSGNNLPELTAGEADFSNYVSLGNSLTAGFTDGGLFIASQQNSLPNILSQQFALAGGGNFVQPLMNDNYGGLAVAGTRIQDPRLVFDGSGPTSLESVIGPVTVSTDIALNNPSGPFNNLGVPGAKSYHLLANGYGNIANLQAGLANPYFVRMTGSTPDASVLELAMVQNPTFFTLWPGENDVLGYALSGGESNPDSSNYDPITDQALFDTAVTTLVTALASTGAKGVVANIPDVTTIANLNTVPHNPLDPSNPQFGPQIPTLNMIFGALNQVYVALGAPERTVIFSADEASAVVIIDESLTDIAAQITGALNASPTFPAFIEQFGLPAEAAPAVANLLGVTYGQTRQATEEDLLVLTSSQIIGTVNTDYVGFLMSQGLPQDLAGQFSVEGITLPLADKWVLIPSEQDEIASATSMFNSTLETAAAQAGLAYVDTHALLNQLANGGIPANNFILTSDLVTGGAFSVDGVHPTARGYALIANEFMRAIDLTYGSNFEESGNLVDVGDYPTNYSPLLQ